MKLRTRLQRKIDLQNQLPGELARASTSDLHNALEFVSGEVARANYLQRALNAELHVRSRGHNDDSGCVAGARCSQRDPYPYVLDDSHPYRNH